LVQQIEGESILPYGAAPRAPAEDFFVGFVLRMSGINSLQFIFESLNRKAKSRFCFYRMQGVFEKRETDKTERKVSRDSFGFEMKNGSD